MEDDKLIEALRTEFAPRVRELCADDNFDCAGLCAGNLLTSECIVFQAADRLRSQSIENINLRAQLTERDKRLAAAVEDIAVCCETCKKMILDDHCYVCGGGQRCQNWVWRGQQETGSSKK